MRAHSARRNRWLVVLATAGVALAGATPASVVLGGEPIKTYLPLIEQSFLPASLANGSFEDNTVIGLPNWPNCRYDGPTDPQTGNQPPEGWSFYSPADGQVMPFPTKMQGGNLVPAISDGPGEYVHRCQWQFPEEEWPGGPRALILDGYWSYKAFGYFIAQALRLSQTLPGFPGEYLRVSGYILGETHVSLLAEFPRVLRPIVREIRESPSLEDDNFVASVQLGGAADTRLYSQMIQHHDVPGNERAWNRFEVTAQVPPSGQLALTIIVQQNWQDRTDFFLDNFRAERLPTAP